MNEQGLTEEQSKPSPQRADVVHRYLAKFIDGLVLLAFVELLPSMLGFLCGLTFLLIADGFKGQSPGKWLIGLSVIEVNDSGERPCQFKASLIRNSPFAVAFFLSALPVLQLILIPTAVLPIVAAEAYFVWTDERGSRLGDIFAATRVIERESRAQ